MVLLNRIMPKKKQVWVISSLFIFIVVAIAALAVYVYRHDLVRSVERATLPEAVDYGDRGAFPSVRPDTVPQANSARATIAPHVPTTDSGLPPEINLAVPFTVQAPHANWELPYKDFCEEASVLMVMRYVNGQPILSPDDADAGMLAIKEFEEARFGYYRDTNVADTATVITEHFNYPNIAVVENPTASDIRAALAAGKPVIMPAAGQYLGNPYFQAPGPPYHMLVIKGYTKDGRFITNDPGTRRGADFIYDEDVLMNALHDYRSDGNFLQGQKIIIIVG